MVTRGSIFDIPTTHSYRTGMDLLVDSSANLEVVVRECRFLHLSTDQILVAIETLPGNNLVLFLGKVTLGEVGAIVLCVKCKFAVVFGITVARESTILAGQLLRGVTGRPQSLALQITREVQLMRDCMQ